MSASSGNDKFKLTSDGRVYFRGSRTYSNKDIYEGEFVDNLRHGVGTLKFYNSGDRYEGEFEHDFMHGYGVYIWATVINESDEVISGRRYEGNWKEGHMHGQGIYRLGNGDIYTGTFSKGRYEGKGTLKYANGDLYDGEWLRGLPGGQIKIKYISGDTYEGGISVGKFEGKGKYVYNNELGSYDGEWSLGRFHGQGVRLYSNGSKYVGNFRNGKVHGDGMMFFAYGDQYLGEWRNGHMEGKGVYNYSHGDSYEGAFLQGFPHGEGKYQYRDGTIYHGEFNNVKHVNRHKAAEGMHRLPSADGLRHGIGVRLWNTGARYEGQWVEDKIHGAGALTNKQGAKYEGEFYNGVRWGRGKQQFGNMLGFPYVCPLGHKHNGTGFCVYSGRFQSGFLHGDGELKCIAGPWYKGQWAHGKRHGQGTYHYLKTGEIGDAKRMFIGGIDSMYRLKEFSGTWDNNIRNGDGVATYTNGDSIKGNFLNGHPHGTMVVTFSSSSKQRAASYKNGTRICWLDERRKGRRRSTVRRSSRKDRSNNSSRGSSKGGSSSRERDNSSRSRSASPEPKLLTQHKNESR